MSLIRHFAIRHYVDGKRVEEGVGWASQKWTAKKAAALRTKLENNKKTGQGPRTLAEMREQGDLEREQARRDAKAKKKLDVSLSQSFRLPKVDNERQRYLTIDEETLLLEKVKARGETAYRMAILSLDTGMRFKEIVSLTWGCVDIDKDSIKVLDSKGRDRYVPMTARVKSLFESLVAGKGKDLVFPAHGGKAQVHVPSSFTRGARRREAE